MLKHEAIIKFYTKNNNIFNVLFSSKSHDDFIKKMILESDNYENYSYSSKEKMLGDLYEIFIECFLTFFTDTRIGIINYEPLPSKDDNGVDGIGRGITKNQLITIQIKFRSDSSTHLLSDDLKQFGFQSIVKYEVDYKDSERNMVLITNCKGLDYYTEDEVFLKKIRVINGDNISLYTNNALGFWTDSLKKINERLNTGLTFIPNKEYEIEGILFYRCRRKEGDFWVLINKEDPNDIRKYTNEELIVGFNK